ncbi:MAG: NAD(P)/FAD-dependent oxidoreductase [Candidatus Bathyarchaeota archaeon]|nr:NAD(P)/FAD-dependent oxidoreductase [Candidatus Bathyarchaeota archaeon]
MEHSRVYDVVVVGAGTGGCSTALFAARQGLKVCIVDVKKESDIGRKVCGDAIGKHHFDNLGLPYPWDAIINEVKGMRVHSPNRSTVFEIVGEGVSGFMLRRHRFGQNLLREALNRGVELYDSTRALKPILDGGAVVGVIGERGGVRVEFKGRVTVDASGVIAVLRRNIPEELLPERFVKPEDIQVAYREVRTIGEGYDEYSYGDIYLSRAYAPGGYAWIFPRSDGTVNVGVGIQCKRGYPNPRTLLYKFLDSVRCVGDTVIDSGGGLVPTRRPLVSLVADGFMLVGDSACQVNPIHGGGIGPSMYAGKLAAEAIVEAYDRGLFTAEGLWSYNVRYMRSYGAKQAALDILRRFLQDISDEDIDYGMSARLLSEDDILKASMYGTLKVKTLEKVKRFIRGSGRLKLLLRLRRISVAMNEVRRLYERFPRNIGEFRRWLYEARSILP